MCEQLRIGFLGAGLIATYHSKSLRVCGSTIERAGVFDPDARRAADFAAASGHTAMVGEDELLDSCDAVYICAVAVRQAAHATNFHGHEGIEDVATATVRFTSGALGTLASVWHDNLARPSLRRVEVFCERRDITIEGDDWFGPVAWSNTDGDSHSLGGDELVAAVEPLRDGSDNPDECFVRAVLAGTTASPGFDDAVAAHRIIQAMYISAGRNGDSVEVGGG